MPLFNYTALDRQGNRQSGNIEAPSKDLALNKLTEEGLNPLAVEPVKQAKNVEDMLARFRDIKPDVLVYFSRQLATMIDSGMSPLRALSVLEEQESNPKFREIISDVISKVESGKPLAEAFAGHPQIFTELYVAMIRSGEESGNLHGALKELANQLEKSARLRKAIKSASTYPKVVLAFAFLLMSGLLLTLIPRFAKIFEDTVAATYDPESGEPPPDASLPALTQFMVDLSHLLYPDRDRNWTWFLEVIARFATLFAIVIGIRKLVKRILREPGPRRRWDAYKLHAPMKIGPLVQKIAIARFSRTFASLLKAGVPTVQALEIVADTAGNVLVSEAVIKARDQMLAGANIADPLARSDAFPPIVSRMIEVGEETGQLEGMLSKVAEFFEEEVDLAIKGLTSIIEPLMIIVVGGAVGLVIISIYLPIFGIYDKIQTATIFLPWLWGFWSLEKNRIVAGLRAYRTWTTQTRLTLE